MQESDLDIAMPSHRTGYMRWYNIRTPSTKNEKGERKKKKKASEYPDK